MAGPKTAAPMPDGISSPFAATAWAIAALTRCPVDASNKAAFDATTTPNAWSFSFSIGFERPILIKGLISESAYDRPEAVGSRVETPQPVRHNLAMAQHDRRTLYSLVAFYAALTVGWAAFAGWVVPPLLAAEHARAASLTAVEALHPEVSPHHSSRETRSAAGASAPEPVLIAIVLHLTIVLILLAV